MSRLKSTTRPEWKRPDRSVAAPRPDRKESARWPVPGVDEPFERQLCKRAARQKMAEPGSTTSLRTPRPLFEGRTSVDDPECVKTH
ncbi:conserved hypothetical protein [Ricinus communis]|uniref:Uncharacterized protein n=1 Tax=Ricinus communis TaxID=3988 RepID=B9TBD9_RICCO|nr:conserved hypothetical protein [Ricinus communis]